MDQAIEQVLMTQMSGHRSKVVDAVGHLVRSAPVPKAGLVEEDVR